MICESPIIINIDKIPDENEPYNKTIRPTDFWGNGDEKTENEQSETLPIEDSETDVDDNDLPF